jgi:polar amino acid transport system substrate-binding protein
MPTRPYYQARYVLIVKEAGWNSLADIPTSQPIGAGIGTVGDLRLIQYLKTLQPENRWPRHPMSSDEAALKSLLEGSLAAALVWEPSLWAARQRDPAFEKLRVISSGQLSESPVGVGGVVASDNTFVRSAIDDAIAALTADGTIDRLLNHYDFPAAAPGH